MISADLEVVHPTIHLDVSTDVKMEHVSIEPTSPVTRSMTVLMGVMNMTVCVMDGSVIVDIVWTSPRGVMESSTAVMAVMSGTVHPVMQLSSDVFLMEDVSMETKFATKTLIAMMLVMRKIVVTETVFVGLKGKQHSKSNHNLPKKMLNFRFKCLDGSCIQLKDRCNHVHNCAHGEDEEQCAGVCGGDQWMCADTRCIDKSQVCDNVTQCEDASDEWDNCHCYINQMGVCQDTGECLQRFRICDGTKDCKDGSDEIHCLKPWRTDNNFWYTSSTSSYYETSTEESSKSSAFSSYVSSFTEPSAMELENTLEVDKKSTRENSETGYASDDATNYVSKEDIYTTPRYPDFPMEFLTSSRPKFGGFQPMSLKREQDIKKELQYQISVASSEPTPNVRVKVYPRFQRVRPGQDAIIQCRDEGLERTSVKWKRANSRPLPRASKEVSNIKHVILCIIHTG